MKCGACFDEVPAGKFCDRCGAKVDGAASRPEKAAPSPPAGDEASPRRGFGASSRDILEAARSAK